MLASMPDSVLEPIIPLLIHVKTIYAISITPSSTKFKVLAAVAERLM
jgi:hypothetical protein